MAEQRRRLVGVVALERGLEHVERALLVTELALPRAMLNSIFIASVGSVLTTLFCAMGGYGLSKFRFRGQESLTSAILGTVVLPGALLLGGCGQKGPLYLPDHNRSEVPVTPASSNTSPDSQKDTHNDTDKDADKPAHRAP